MKNLKQFTISQVGDIFQIEKFKTLTPVFYKGQEYQFQFDFGAEKKGLKIINIIKMVHPLKVVGFFKY